MNLGNEIKIDDYKIFRCDRNRHGRSVACKLDESGKLRLKLMTIKLFGVIETSMEEV